MTRLALKDDFLDAVALALYDACHSRIQWRTLGKSAQMRHEFGLKCFVMLSDGFGVGASFVSLLPRGPCRVDLAEEVLPDHVGRVFDACRLQDLVQRRAVGKDLAGNANCHRECYHNQFALHDVHPLNCV